MQNPLFKLAALAGVISAGVLVVFEAQKHLAHPGEPNVAAFAALDGDASPAPQAAQSSPGPAEAGPAAPPVQSEPGLAIEARGPEQPDATPAPSAQTTDPFAFLYTESHPGAAAGNAAPAEQSEPAFLPDEPLAPIDVTQSEPSDAASANPFPGQPDAGEIQLAAAESEVPEQAEPSPLTPFPAELKAPVLLTPPLPPREEEPARISLAAEPSGALQASYEAAAHDPAATLIPSFDSDEGADAEDSQPLQLAQTAAAPVPRDRTRTAPAPQPSPDTSENPLDLFGPLPSAETPPASPAALPADEELLLPPSGSSVPVSEDPFMPRPIAGTEPDEPVFAPDSPAPPPARNRQPTPPISLDAAAPPTQPEPEPIEDLFLPQVIPGAAPASSNPEPAGPAIEPATPAPNAAPAPAPERDRTRGAPSRAPSPVPQALPFAPDPAPTPAADPATSSDPFPLLFDNTEPPVNAAPTGGTPPAPAFPAPEQLEPLPPAPGPTRSSIPSARSSIPAGASVPPANAPLSNSSIPEPIPSRAPVVPSPAPSSPPGVLTGTGVVDASAPAGAQPELQIEKDAPPRAVLNQPLVYNIRVRNVGATPAHQVIVEDSIPRGSTLKGTIPEAELDPNDKHLIWKLGTLAPAEDRLIRVQIVPTEPGEIGSVATVRFVGRIASKTVITAPKLEIEMTGPAETAVGDVPVYRFRVSNTGDGDAANVIVKSVLPSLFEHPSGAELEYEVGTLRAGQTREFELALSAVRAGQATHSAVVSVDGREQDSISGDVMVLASRLSLERTGPEQRFVNRPANYETQVSNQSHQPLRNVTIVETLPAGVELAAVPEHGRFDPARHTITWVVPELRPQESRQFRSSLVTADPGSYATRVQVWDAGGNKAETTSQLQVTGFSSLKVDVAQTTQEGGEVAVGEQVALRMTVANRGSAPATNVITEFQIPPELEFVAAKPQRYQLQDGKVRFEPIPHMDVDAQQVIDIVCVARQPGTPRIAASIWSKEQYDPIRQEEAVVVFRENP